MITPLNQDQDRRENVQDKSIARSISLNLKLYHILHFFEKPQSQFGVDGRNASMNKSN